MDKVELRTCLKSHPADNQPWLEALVTVGKKLESTLLQKGKDLYIFHIAADYQFHFVKNWVKTHSIGSDNLFEDSWSTQLEPLSNQISEILQQ